MLWLWGSCNLGEYFLQKDNVADNFPGMFQVYLAKLSSGHSDLFLLFYLENVKMQENIKWGNTAIWDGETRLEILLTRCLEIFKVVPKFKTLTNVANYYQYV